MRDEIIVNGQFNIGYICTTLQCERGHADRVALRCVSHVGDVRDFTFGQLDLLTNRFANALVRLGLRPGDVIFTFLPKCPEQFVVFLGALKTRCVVGTLFSSFGEGALLDRLADSHAKCVVTKLTLLKRLRNIWSQLPTLSKIIVVDAQNDISCNELSYAGQLSGSEDDFVVSVTPAETPSVLHYTSGSTGKPKGVQHLHRSVLHVSRTTKEVLGLSLRDRFWCTADQGWVTGTSYGIVGPWTRGVTQIQYEGRYEAAKWFKLLVDQRVTVWYTSPTALRMVMQQEDEFFKQYDLSELRRIYSVGEPLNPEILGWSRRVLGRDVYDTWWQTETGGIMISNKPGMRIRPG